MNLSPSRHWLSIRASSSEPDDRHPPPVHKPSRHDSCHLQDAQAYTTATGMGCESGAMPNLMPTCKTKGLRGSSISTFRNASSTIGRFISTHPSCFLIGSSKGIPTQRSCGPLFYEQKKVRDNTNLARQYDSSNQRPGQCSTGQVHESKLVQILAFVNDLVHLRTTIRRHNII